MSTHEPQIPPGIHPCDAIDAEWLHEVRCPECQYCDIEHKVMPAELEAFTARILEHFKVPPAEARITAQVLVAADLRGVSSHGVARLGRYLAGIRDGYIRPGVKMEVVEPASTLGRIDAQHGLGQVAGDLGMRLALTKAKQHGMGLVTVKNSNHYGIAGYYILQALEQRMLAISMTNAAPLVIPTGGSRAMLGTNPIAFGAPAEDSFDYLLDTATSVVPRGKLEVFDRNQKQMPTGWAVDENGYDAQNPGHVLRNLVERIGGGILPLGGRGDEFGGHKGYGFAMLVDILCGVLSGSAFGAQVNDLKRPLPPGEIAAPRVGHFFLALDIGKFMPMPEFTTRMDQFIRMIKDSPCALDHEQILVHGEKEYIRAELHGKSGIPLAENVLNTLRKIAEDAGLPSPRTVAEMKA